jgi:hypothetical protein
MEKVVRFQQFNVVKLQSGKNLDLLISSSADLSDLIPPIITTMNACNVVY